MKIVRKLFIINLFYQHFVNKINEEKSMPNINLEKLYLKHIENRDIIKEISKNNTKLNISSLSTNIIMYISNCFNYFIHFY